MWYSTFVAYCTNKSIIAKVASWHNKSFIEIKVAHELWMHGRVIDCYFLKIDAELIIGLAMFVCSFNEAGRSMPHSWAISNAVNFHRFYTLTNPIGVVVPSISTIRALTPSNSDGSASSIVLFCWPSISPLKTYQRYLNKEMAQLKQVRVLSPTEGV